MIRAYTSTAKWFHWVVFLLVTFELITAAILSELPRGATKLSIVNVHMSFGTIIIFAMIARLLWRITHPVPPMPAATPSWQVVVARIVHFIFYALLFIIPFTGWIWANAIGWQVTIFGFVALPALVAKGSSLLHLVGLVHTYLAWGIAALVVVHVLASLYHWYTMFDDILERILPHDRHTVRLLRYFEQFRGSPAKGRE